MATNFKAELRTLTILHWSILFPPILFGVFVFFHNTYITEMEPDYEFILIYFPVVLFLFSLIGSRIFFNFYLRNLYKPEDKLEKKLMVYRTGHIIRLAILEVAALFGAVVSFITYTNVNLIIVVIIALVFISLRPTIFKIETELNLSPDEKDMLEGDYVG